MDSLATIAMRTMGQVVHHIERSLLDEDEEVISGGPIVDIAKQELQVLEYHINYASFLLAARIRDAQAVNNWISEARKIAFCLADQIHMYAIRGSSDSELYHMKNDIGMLRIAELISRIEGYNVVGNEIGQMPSVVRNRESISLLTGMSPFIQYSRPMLEDKIVRMESKIEKVKEFLKGARPVLFITGGQGSGKTTLMKVICNDDSECCWCWVDIAETGGLVGLLKMLLKKSKVDCDFIQEFEIMKMVHDTFKDKPYLIVLDNVQDTYVLYSLKHVLNNCEGKIICLTRKIDIQEDENQDVLHIRGLEPYDSLKLFMSAAFCNFDSTDLLRENFNSIVRDDALRRAITSKYQPPADQLVKMVKLLNEILSKCQDNPWNIWSIGTLLDSCPHEKWEEIEERIDGMLIDGTKMNEKNDPHIQLEDAKLDDATVRHCFLYCLAFPKTAESCKETSKILENSGGIPTRKLIRLWAAEGYVQDSSRQSQEEEAECLLHKLIKKNLLVVKKKGFDGEVLKCSVNDHIWALAAEMCEKQKFCKLVHNDSDEASSPSRRTKCFPISLKICTRGEKTLSDRYRMLAVHDDGGVKEVWKRLSKDLRLRSLLYFRTGRTERSELELSFRRRYMFLRTLELQGAHLSHLPSNIGCLVCLRYLGLRNTQLEDLPQSLQRLVQLICLDIRDTYIAEVADVSYFREMRHLYLTKSFRSHSVAIRDGLHSLVHLQTLSGVAYGEFSGKIPFERQISHLRRLSKLSMKKASSTSFKNICDAINGIDSLKSLAISCDMDGQELDLSALKIGKNLRKLKLGGPMGNFCDLEPFMQSITFLYLWDSKLSIDLLDTLGGLENLLVLSLLNASTSQKMICYNGYQKLKKLSIISLDNLSECQFHGNSMVSLEELVVAKCGNLKKPPQRIDQLPSLREVHLTGMLPEFCDKAKDKLKDKVYVLPDALQYVVSSRAAARGGN